MVPNATSWHSGSMHWNNMAAAIVMVPSSPGLYRLGLERQSSSLQPGVMDVLSRSSLHQPLEHAPCMCHVCRHVSVFCAVVQALHRALPPAHLKHLPAYLRDSATEAVKQDSQRRGAAAFAITKNSCAFEERYSMHLEHAVLLTVMDTLCIRAARLLPAATMIWACT